MAQRIRALVFDLFDTLVDTHIEHLPIVELDGVRMPSTAGVLHENTVDRHGVPLDEFARALREVDRTFRATRYAKLREVPSEERFAAVAERLGAPAELARVWTELHMGCITRLSATPDHHPALLSRLREQRRIGLCSNFTHSPTALALLERDALRPHFDALVVSDAVGFRKPHPEIFLRVLAALDVPPEEVLHVGDNLDADVRGASELGMRTCWITRRVHEPEKRLAKHEGPAPDWRVRDLAELPELLDEYG